ncbi:hypothetical protein EKH55_2051 [Sinorhizobium alkalisoli]|nr:hypothetical protein EKH55_2051 [Sinorhizobium alkalisoli]
MQRFAAEFAEALAAIVAVTPGAALQLRYGSPPLVAQPSMPF